METTEQELLNSALADIDDAGPRLVLADYLDEHGSPNWAKRLRSNWNGEGELRDYAEARELIRTNPHGMSADDWSHVLSQPRCAGGHYEIMACLYGRNTEVIASWTEDDYQGSLCYIYKLDHRFAVVHDGFGSCSGCDSWEDASSSDVVKMVQGLHAEADTYESEDDLLASKDEVAIRTFTENKVAAK